MLVRKEKRNRGRPGGVTDDQRWGLCLTDKMHGELKLSCSKPKLLDCPVLREGRYVVSMRSRLHAPGSIRPPRFRARATRRTGLHCHNIAVVVRPLPRDRRPLLVHLEAVPVPLRGERLVPKAEGDGPLAHTCRGEVRSWHITRRGQGVARWLVEEADDEDVVMHGRSVIRERERLVGAVRHGGLRAVEHEDVLFALVDRDRSLPGVESFGEIFGHFEERVVVVATPVTAIVPVLSGRVRGSNVRTLTPVVPGHNLNEVWLQLEEVQPFLDEDSAVLLVRPVHVRAVALEEPGRDGRHPFLARGGAASGIGRVKGCIVGGGQAGMNPGEDAVGEGLDGGVGLLSIFGHSTGDE